MSNSHQHLYVCASSRTSRTDLKNGLLDDFGPSDSNLFHRAMSEVRHCRCACCLKIADLST